MHQTIKVDPERERGGQQGNEKQRWNDALHSITHMETFLVRVRACGAGLILEMLLSQLAAVAGRRRKHRGVLAHFITNLRRPPLQLTASRRVLRVTTRVMAIDQLQPSPHAA